MPLQVLKELTVSITSRISSDISSGWDDFYVAGKRIFGLITLWSLITGCVLLLEPTIPAMAQKDSGASSSSPSLEYQMAENNYQLTETRRRLNDLSSVTTDIALLRLKMEQQNDKITELSAAISQIRTTAFTGVVGVMCWVIVQLFQFFEQRVMNRRDTGRRDENSD